MRCTICLKEIPPKRQRYQTCSSKCGAVLSAAKHKEAAARTNAKRAAKAIKIKIDYQPECCDDDTWKEWHHFSKLSHKSIRDHPRYCDDCLPEFRAKMRKENKCTQHKLWEERTEQVRAQNVRENI